MRHRTYAGGLFLLFFFACSAEAADKLTVGTKAPQIDIEHWISDKEPISEFKPGHVYVLEFWATWCGPCIGSIPHLRELQLRHGGSLSVISVSDESLDTINGFLERKTGDTTYGKLTNDYWLATDPDGSVKQDYMRAAELHGIPSAFIVGKTGVIEWIGHPMAIDEPVASVISGKWDRQEFARQRAEEEALRGPLQAAFRKASQHLYEEALKDIDALSEKFQSPEQRLRVEQARTRIKAQRDAHVSRPMNGGLAGNGFQVDIRRLAIGDQVTFTVTGRTTGVVWGDSIYAMDSDLGATAVHAGLVRDGETKLIKLWVVPSPSSFAEANRNGVQSKKWPSRYPAFILQLAQTQPPQAGTSASRPGGSGLAGKAIGETLEMKVTGRKTGPVWGTGIYTADSDVATAAVHAGVLKDGEEGTVLLAVVNSPDKHAGSKRNGVTTGRWGRYTKSYVIQLLATAAEER